MSTPRRPAPRSRAAPITATGRRFSLAATRANLLGGGEEVHGLENGAAIRVLLADDDEGYAASLQLLIEEQPELTVVGVAHDGEEAIDLVKRLEPDAVVVDLHMPRVDGVAAVA